MQDLSIETMLKSASRGRARPSIKTAWKLLGFQRRWAESEIVRSRLLQDENLVVPQIIILSPTTVCNYSCFGCYAHNYSHDSELSLERIDRLLTEAKDLGTFAFLIGGGEPFLQLQLADLLGKHKSLLFLTFTNGSQIDQALAEKLAGHGNVVPLLSVDGDLEQTNARRGLGAYERVLSVMACFRSVNLVFGFSVMATRRNLTTITTESFTDELLNHGCGIGIFVEYVPVGNAPDQGLVLGEEHRQQLREYVIRSRRNKSLILFLLPDDADDGTGCGAASRFIHISANGDIEPCPFAHYAQTSVRDMSLREALRSPFLEEIRGDRALLKHCESGCALVNNSEKLQRIALRTGARATSNCCAELPNAQKF